MTRISALFRTAISRASSLRSFSSSAAAVSHRAAAWKFYSDDGDGDESAVYKHALKFQRPSTVKTKPNFHNSVSFIGTIVYPLRRVNTRDEASLAVYTLLNVSSKPTFKIMLKMWDGMAEHAMEHLKRNDLIYVRGQLRSYPNTGQNGNPLVFHEVIVKEINFVARHDKASTCQESSKKMELQGAYQQSSKKMELQDSDEDKLERSSNRIHLWQVFFSNPYEWWDNRKDKVNSKGPDFKHRHTGEALWIRADDPPWIRRQLELLDSRYVGNDTGNIHVSPLRFDGEYE